MNNNLTNPTSLINEAYINYCNHTKSNDSTWNEWMRDNGDGSLSMYTETEFTDKIKTDNIFAKKWGVEFSKHILSDSQRMDYWFKNNKPNRDICDTVDSYNPLEKHTYFDEVNIPKQIVTLIYNNKSAGYYE